ncbi:MAG TPA: phage tail protein [Candidatus Kapabacteria bacterium]|nr:phage tail protein [Candidatus Kapabacteria bacterium]
MAQQDATTYLLLDGHQGLNPRDGWRVASAASLQAGPDGLRLASVPPPPVPIADDAGTFAGMENPTGVAIAPDGCIYVADGHHDAILRIVPRDGRRAWAHYFRVAGGANANDRFVYLPSATRLERWPRTIRTTPADAGQTEVLSTQVWDEESARRIVLRYIGADDHHASGGCSCGCNSASAGAAAGNGNGSAGCGCGGTAVKSSGGCGCGASGSGATLQAASSGASGGSGGCTCGCTSGGNAAAASIEKEWEDFYPENLDAGTLCDTSPARVHCVGGTGSEPRRFNAPHGIVISRQNTMYVADTGNNRIQCFALHGWMLREIWGARAAATGAPVAGAGLGEFDEPWDVTLDAKGNLYVADRNNHRVQKRCCRTGRFAAFDGTVYAAHFFQVLYGSFEQSRFVYIPALARVERWPGAPGTVPADSSGITVLSFAAATTEQARDAVLEFLSAAGSRDILVEWDGAYPAQLGSDTAFGHPEHLLFDTANRLYVVDADTPLVKMLDTEGRVLGQMTFANQLPGSFEPTAVTLDAQGHLMVATSGGLHRFGIRGGRFGTKSQAALHGCSCGTACDAAEVVAACGRGDGAVKWIAPDAGFRKSGTYISSRLDSVIDRCQWHRIEIDFAAMPGGSSVTVWTYSSQLELTDADIALVPDEEWRTGQVNADDFLVLSGPGRYLWLKIAIQGDGLTTPVLRSLIAHYPRVTYMQYLPAIYQADPVGKDFMERFLSIFETVFSRIETRVSNLVRYLDPDGVPADFLSWLAGWIDMTFLRTWSEATRRSLLRHAAELYKLRGTPEGMRRMIKLATGIDVRIQEGFRRRNWLFLAHNAGLGQDSGVWGDAIVHRLQLDQYSAIGDFSLVSTGDPLHDPFLVYAHSFAVYVDAAVLNDPDQERMLRYLIEQEKPAHTSYTLEKVQPRFRVGVQATVGLDTSIGTYPRIVLNECATLGCDTVLGAAPEDRGPAVVRVGAHARPGVDAVVG